MNPRHALLGLAMLVVAGPVFAEVAAPTAETVLGTLYQPHPRLFLHDDALAALKERAETDTVLAAYVQRVISRADGYLDDPPLVHKLVGPRLLSVSRACLSRIQTLALAWRWTGDAKYAEAVKQNLLTVCAFPDWNPSHFLDTAEMSNAVGLGYDWTYSTLDDETKQTIRAGLIRHGMEPGKRIYRRGGWWTENHFNWNQVCNGGMLVGALAIAETDPEQARFIVPAAAKSLPLALATYGPDGAWPEGPGYWGYATIYTCYGLDALRTALGTDYGLSDIDGLDHAGDFPLATTGPAGRYFNYADVGERARRGAIPALFWLSRRYGDPFWAAREQAHLSGRMGDADAMHVVWYPGHAKVEAWPPLDLRFRGPVDLAVFRGSWDDPNTIWAAIKGGYNRVAHGHLDLGSFEMEALGVRWVRDLGSDDYNMPRYFDGGRQSGQRWTYYRLNSLSHNLVILDGTNQRVEAKAEMVRFSTGESPFAIVDTSSAYPERASRMRRGLRLVVGRRALLVQDEITLKRKTDVAWGVMTDAKITLEGSTATLERDGKTLVARVLVPEGATFSVESAEQPPPQKANKGVRRLEVQLPGAEGAVTIAVLLSPQWEGKLAAGAPVGPLADW